MAKTNKPALKEFLSPKAVASYPKLLIPDTKYNTKGTLSTKLIVSAEEAEVFRTQAAGVMEPFIESDIATAMEVLSKAPKNPKTKKYLEDRQAAKAKGFNMSIADQVDGAGEATGKKEVTFKQSAKITFMDKGEEVTRDIQIPIFDAKGNRIITHKDNKLVPNAIQIWSGSEIKVRYQIIPAYIASSSTYHATLRPIAVQVVKLVSGSGARDAEGYGFEAEEGGFEVDAATADPMAAEAGAGEVDASGY